MRLLSTLQAQAKRTAKLAAAGKKGGGSRTPAKKPQLDPVEEAELRQAFDLFDKDKSGSIDSSELGNVLKSLGQELDETGLHNLFVMMDADGSGSIDFDEFTAVMADPGEKQTAAQIAASIFVLIDKDGSGVVTVTELKSALLGLGAGLTEEDVFAALQLFDTGGSGDISKQEFIQAIEIMKTFD